MKPELKEIYNIDMTELLSDFKPETDDEFGFWVRMIIGEQNNGGEESFDIFICTPIWLLKNHQKSDIIFGKNYLIVFEYNYTKILNKVKKFLNTIYADSWDEIGNVISKISSWEFEDYKEY